MEHQKKIERMKELSKILLEASKAYYAEDREIMSNFEYDALYDELVALEEETGVVLANSPTVTVGFEAVDELPKEAHESPMLSLGKTKSREELRDWVLDKEALLSWKMDGLTIVLTYQNGELVKAVTRGNGEVGEVITNNAKVFTNVPLKVNFQGDLVLRGEAVISYSDFDKINATIADVDAKYKNPRNLCSGSVRQLNNEITSKRHVQFFAFNLVKADGADFNNSREEQFLFLKKLGFDVVEYKRVDKDSILDAISYYEEKIKTYDLPSDGLVLTFDDIAYGDSLGRTAKFPRNAIAFKWADEQAVTTLLDMEWSPSRTGLINPVAIFDSVELEGTSVSRASVHNVSIVESLELGIGDQITVYKANMIIPQIAENLTRSGKLEIPCQCPACGGKTEIRQVNDVRSLYCISEDCPAKMIGAFTLFVSRDAMNVDGLSEATLEKFIAKGFIKEYADIFKLTRYEEEITELEGFGKKSYAKLIDSIEEARKTTLPRVIYAIGIQNIGVANAKMLAKHFDYDLSKFMDATVEEYSAIDGVGEVIAQSIRDYFDDEAKRERVLNLVKELTVEKPEANENAQVLTGKSFVVTGSVHVFESRNALKEQIEALGGKLTGSVTGNTVALINNDTTSTSGKNKKAKELGVPILSEEEFVDQFMPK